MNDYFNHSLNVVPGSQRPGSAHINNIFDEIAKGFDKIDVEADLRGHVISLATNTGSATQWLASLDYTPELEDGYHIRVSTAFASTGATTLDLNELGIKQVRNADGTVIAAGSITADTIVDLYWDAANDWWLLGASNAVEPTALVTTFLTPLSLTGLTSVSFAIPTGVKRVVMFLEAMDYDSGGGGSVYFRVGDSVTGILTSTYQGLATSVIADEVQDHFQIDDEIWIEGLAIFPDPFYGHITFEQVSALVWVWRGTFSDPWFDERHTTTGWIQLTAGSFLDEITFNATVGFDGGTIGGRYKG